MPSEFLTENVKKVEVERVSLVKSELGEDEVMVCLTLKPGKTITPMELIDYCEERMAFFMIPRYVRIMNQLPKTATERVMKAELREEGITPNTWNREAEGYKLKR